MSVVEKLSSLFSKKSPEPVAETSGDLSLGMPDASIDPMMSTGTTGGGSSGAMTPIDPDSFTQDDGAAPLDAVEEAELISVPLLGRRTIIAHQRILFTLLALSLVVLGSVAVFAVRQADTVAQQVAGTGQSLMQSQRLAKSVSQALVGSAQAVPDVKESADVLAKTVRGLKAGDESLRLQPVGTEMQEDVEKITPLMERAEKNCAPSTASRPTCWKSPRRCRRSSCSRTRRRPKSPPPASS
jgi:twitching motility protein PilJ